MANAFEHIKSIIDSHGTYNVQFIYGEPVNHLGTDTIFISYDLGLASSYQVNNRYLKFEQNFSIYIYDNLKLSELNSLIKHINDNAGYFADSDFGSGYLSFVSAMPTTDNSEQSNSIIKLSINIIY